jgi:hypothetical protein
VTHAITPPQKPLTLFAASFGGFDPTYDGDFSDDLTHAIFRTASPVTASPDVENVRNLYVRDDLRASGPGDFRLVTPCPGCSAPLPSFPFILNRPSLAGTSADMSHVLFESATPLTSDAPSGPNLYEWQDGVVRLAGVLPDSACESPPCIAAGAVAGQGAANSLYTPHTISSDGSRAFFTDPSTANLYMRVDHSSTVQINASERTPADAPSGARYEDATPDGAHVFFTSVERLTNDAFPHPGDHMLYMYSVQPDAEGHHLTLLSVDREPSDDATTSDEVKGVIGTSDDGSYVYFTASSGQLVPGAPTDPGSGPLPGADKIYVWHDGSITYIGATPVDNELANLDPIWRLQPKQARVTPDGLHLLFMSMGGQGLTGYDHGSCPGNNSASGACQELYVYSVGDPHPLACASCNPSGAPATADATDFSAADITGAASTWHLSHAITDDGRYVFFSTRDALVPEDVNNKIDAYEYDTQARMVHLLSSGRDASDSYFMEASASGADVFIDTRQKLTGWDIDDNYDLYDVRVNGGLPEPEAAPECAGEGCRGQAPVAPATQPLASSAPGAGNLVGTPPKPKPTHRLRCKRDRVPRRVHSRLRCVRHKAARHRPRKAVH